MRDFVSSILETEGDYEVFQVENGFEALRELPRRAYGLIVTDINIPDVSGIELTQFVRRSRLHAKTPVIVISTDSSDVDRERALEAGASAFLAKPFTPQQLHEVIAQAGVAPEGDAGG